MTEVSRHFCVAFIPLILVSACSDHPKPLGDAGRVTEPNELPCTLDFVPTGVVLVSDNKRTPDPGNWIARNTRGAYFTTTYVEGVVAAWDSAGTYIKDITRSGDGPGEVRGIPLVYVDRSDSIHMRDNKFIWSVFAPDGKYVRRMSGAHLGYGYSGVRFMQDGRILVSSATPQNNDSSYFHILNRNGDVVRRFGVIAAVDSAEFMGGGVSRAISNVIGGKFWAAPRYNSLSGYTLEQWDTAGNLLVTARRSVPWFDAKMTSTIPERGEPPLPFINYLHQDSSETLLVFTIVPNQAWKPRTSPRTDWSQFDFHVDVIDAKRIAPLGHASGPREAFPAYIFGDSHEGYRNMVGVNGEESRQMVTYNLKCSETLAGALSPSKMKTYH